MLDANTSMFMVALMIFQCTEAGSMLRLIYIFTNVYNVVSNYYFGCCLATKVYFIENLPAIKGYNHSVFSQGRPMIKGSHRPTN